MRTFDLINSRGEVYKLTLAHRYSGFMTKAEGLGYAESVSYQQVGDNFYEMQDNINQGVISGEIQFFQPHAYRAFTAFALFCQDKSLTLYYRTPSGEYMRDGRITKIERAEGGDSLKVKIEFTATGLWYQPIDETATDNLYYNSDSAIDSPISLSFTGVEVTNSTIRWRQYIDGTLLYVGQLDNVTIASTDVIYVRSDTNPYEIYRDRGGSITNFYQYSDFATKRFFHIQKGENRFNVSGATITLKGRILYDTI